MTKSLILGAALALALSTGAAMAEEGDAQNLFNGSPRIFHEIENGTYFKTGAGARVGGATSGTYAVQSQQLSAVPDGSDGGGR